MRIVRDLNAYAEYQPGRKKKRNDPPISEHAFGLCWRIQTLFHDSEENAPLPHAIIDTVAHVPANHADQSLTLHEVRAIVNMMLIRTSHRPFRRYSNYPVSNLERIYPWLGDTLKSY